jgi:hypothetical protein
MRVAALVLAGALLSGCSDDEIGFRIEAPDEVLLAPDGAASFRVTGILENETRETVKLEASTVCLAEDWRILDFDGNLAATPREVVCIQMLASRELADGEVLPLAHQVEVPPGRLRPGREYRLVFEFWRYRAETEFATVAADDD